MQALNTYLVPQSHCLCVVWESTAANRRTLNVHVSEWAWWDDVMKSSLREWKLDLGICWVAQMVVLWRGGLGPQPTGGNPGITAPMSHNSSYGKILYSKQNLWWSPVHHSCFCFVHIWKLYLQKLSMYWLYWPIWASNFFSCFIKHQLMTDTSKGINKKVFSC